MFLFIHSFLVLNKKVDYHGPPTVTLSNGDAGASALSRSPHRARPGVVFTKKVDYHDLPAVCLSSMAMRERLFCHTHPTGPDQET